VLTKKEKAILAKHELSEEDFRKAYEVLKKNHIPGPYKAIIAPDA